MQQVEILNSTNSSFKFCVSSTASVLTSTSNILFIPLMMPVVLILRDLKDKIKGQGIKIGMWQLTGLVNNKNKYRQKPFHQQK